MKLKLTSKQMLMLLDKVGVPKGKIISTTGYVLDKILSDSHYFPSNFFNKSGL